MKEIEVYLTYEDIISVIKNDKNISENPNAEIILTKLTQDETAKEILIRAVIKENSDFPHICFRKSRAHLNL